MTKHSPTAPYALPPITTPKKAVYDSPTVNIIDRWTQKKSGSVIRAAQVVMEGECERETATHRARLSYDIKKM
ncbi:hypothetical protein E4T81_05085 [Barnesiella sp. WM24]|uniref:hypothetical protein n=1 Tax=Barnesiella sp. WM24 TaxID=2558278 RepID=UPI0010723725|nr:hypothetical protein [Barnesiella sp. WM24]TFU93969.1 hypothetical protein E4T81_05085 [Barnesiella sp. WM24]